MAVKRVESQKWIGTGSTRLHYLDWLRVLAMLMVFLFHAVHPFDVADWHIKNDELSMVVTACMAFFFPWGMPFFFLIAGASSWFALKRRTGRQYAGERLRRLLVPFIAGSLALMPVQRFFEWQHQIGKGGFDGSFSAFYFKDALPVGPQFFGWAGYHLWFLGFLFAFSLLALPVFLWLKGETGRQIIGRLGAVGERRGGLLLFLPPLLAIQFAFRPFFPQEHDWGEFFILLAFFLSGYVLFADGRLIEAIRRDGKLLLVGAVASTVAVLAILALGDPLTWLVSPTTPQFYLVWAVVTVNAWCWALTVLSAGMHHLDFSDHRLRIGQKAVVPFYVLHQPIVIGVAFFVVQWPAGVLVKLPTVVLISFLLTAGSVRLLARLSGAFWQLADKLARQTGGAKAQATLVDGV